jgi:hypothetical protein
MDGKQHLQALAHAYLAHAEIKQHTLSWRLFNDSKKLKALEEGSDIQLGRYEAAMRWFSANWPADLAWPDDVPRAQVEQAA